MVPLVLLGVSDDGLAIARTTHSGATRPDHAEPCRLESVERLLDERVFEVEARRVAVGAAAVRGPSLRGPCSELPRSVVPAR